MTGLLAQVQYWVIVALSIGAFVLCAYAFVDALRHQAPAYAAAGKLSKPVWLGILGVSALFSFASLGRGTDFLVIIGATAAGVYLADVRPALRELRGSGGSRW